jgi:hypothetical protein
MSDPKTLNFNERRNASAAAKQAMLAKFKPKPAITDPNIGDRALEKELELEQLRAERAAAREERRVAQAKAAVIKADEEALLQEARMLARRAAQRATLEQYAAHRQKRR